MKTKLSLRKCLEFAELACRRAVRSGADQAEAGCGLGESSEAEIEESRLKSAARHYGESLSAHAYCRGGRGHFTIHEISAKAAEEAGRRAAELARAAAPDPDFRSLPEPRPCQAVEGLFDPRLAAAPATLVLELAGGLLDRAAAEEPGCQVSGSLSVSSSRGAFANSLGAALAHEVTSVSAGCLAVIRRRSRQGSFYDFDTGRRLADTDVSAVGASAASGARRYFGGRSIRSARLPVVLGPLAAAALIESVVSAASAESIQRRRSFLTGRLGKRIASPLLTVTDDGLFPAGIYSGPADAEGVPRERLTVIEDGVLRTLLHNSYTAGKAGTRSNGHASGAGCAPTNLRPRLGRSTVAEIVAGVRRGLYVNSAGLSPNPSSGEVSGLVEFGLLIENGRLTDPVANVNVAGDIFEMLADIEAVSSDCREEPGNLMPTILIRKMDISGAG